MAMRASAVTSAVIAAAMIHLSLLAAPGIVTLSIVGTSDLHGQAFPDNGLGGLPLLGGYLNNLRAARAADGGAVLLIDAGDTFQGNLESNLSEGALVVDAYNALGYTAQAVGNHDFDFGSLDSPLARQLPGDLRGALKARAAQARHPFLAANLIDATTGRPVEWPNVRPSVLVEAAGVTVGIVGVMTIDGLRSTIAANVQGLRLAPLHETVAFEAARLRASGAGIVVVAAHAGGRCSQFERPGDLSSCDAGSEIFQMAKRLPPALVDVIVAGHTHGGLGHLVEGIGIIQPYSRGQSFGRVDVLFDRTARRPAGLQLFPPRRVCARQDRATGNCVPASTGSSVVAEYEGRPISADPAIVAAMAPALRRVQALQAASIGVTLDEAIVRIGPAGSPLGNLIADALRSAVPGADVAAINNAARLWADLPRGPITFGQLYRVFPFDNRLTPISITGGELSRWLTNEIQLERYAAVGLSGVAVAVTCRADGMHVELRRGADRIADDERLLAVTIGAPTLNGSLASADFLGGVGPTDNHPVVREVVEDWFRRLGRLSAGERNRVLSARSAMGNQPAGCAAANARRSVAPVSLGRRSLEMPLAVVGAGAHR
jgi:5'-nucleotidase